MSVAARIATFQLLVLGGKFDGVVEVPAGDAPIHVVEFGQVPTVAQFRQSVPTVAEFGGVPTVAQFPTRRIP